MAMWRTWTQYWMKLTKFSLYSVMMLREYICNNISMQETSISPQILTAVVFIISIVCVTPVFMMIFTEKIPVKYIQMPIIVPIVITVMFNGLLKCYFYWRRITRLGETLQRWNRWKIFTAYFCNLTSRKGLEVAKADNHIAGRDNGRQAWWSTGHTDNDW